jgi:thiamine biosynthesis lipoprotein
VRKLVVRLVVILAASATAVWFVNRSSEEGESSASSGPRLVATTRPSMGAEARLTAWTSDERAARAAFDDAFRELERLEGLMSVWRDDSDIVRVNEAAGKEPVKVTQEVFEALREARRFGDVTSGAFDVTFGALSDIWKFDHDQDNKVPSAADIQRRLPLVNYKRLTLDEAARTAYLSRRGMRAHLGGIGKGYAIDRVAGILRQRGLTSFMIQFGGDMYVAGIPGTRQWRVGIQDPRGEGNASFATMELTDAAVSTSGDYERFFLKSGVRYHHIIDPRTGQPARGSRSVTIVADTSTTADALSTGVFVMGPVEGMALIERLPKVEGVIVTDGNEVLVSSGLKGRLTIRAQPTDASP